MACNHTSAIIIGAGPAGLTAAAELCERGWSVTVLEKDPHYVGGISRTIEYKGNRFDIGGHRFFSKSSEIVEWWKKRLPDDFIRVKRLSRIYYRNHFFDYPLRPVGALCGLGPWTSLTCVASYCWARLFPIRPENSFSAWVTNRFGKQLFNTFFKSYTEKVWGMSCEKISADWASQRIKGLSLRKAITNAFKPQARGGEVVKTLIDYFDYPRLGPGMMWEKTRDDLIRAGGKIEMGREVLGIRRNGCEITSIETRDVDGGTRSWEASAYIVSMPLRNLVLAFDPPLGLEVVAAAKRLTYRDFLTVAVTVNKPNLFPDNWIYIHEPSIRVGRIQNFGNWSPQMLADDDTSCLGLEYFCFQGDEIWNMTDADLIELGKSELEKIGLCSAQDVIDGCVVRMEKAYPVYGPDYQQDVQVIRSALDRLSNLQTVGRNGMHKYNNQDHSMMTGLLAARNLLGEKYDLWKVNTDAEYHEAGDGDDTKSGRLVPKPLHHS